MTLIIHPIVSVKHHEAVAIGRLCLHILTAISTVQTNALTPLKFLCLSVKLTCFVSVLWPFWPVCGRILWYDKWHRLRIWPRSWHVCLCQDGCKNYLNLMIFEVLSHFLRFVCWLISLCERWLTCRYCEVPLNLLYMIFQCALLHMCWISIYLFVGRQIVFVRTCLLCMVRLSS